MKKGFHKANLKPLSPSLQKAKMVGPLVFHILNLTLRSHGNVSHVLTAQTGFPLRSSKPASRYIELQTGTVTGSELDEAYSISISEDRITITGEPNTALYLNY